MTNTTKAKAVPNNLNGMSELVTRLVQKKSGKPPSSVTIKAVREDTARCGTI